MGHSDLSNRLDRIIVGIKKEASDDTCGKDVFSESDKDFSYILGCPHRRDAAKLIWTPVSNGRHIIGRWYGYPHGDPSNHFELTREDALKEGQLAGEFKSLEDLIEAGYRLHGSFASAQSVRDAKDEAVRSDRRDSTIAEVDLGRPRAGQLAQPGLEIEGEGQPEQRAESKDHLSSEASASDLSGIFSTKPIGIIGR